MQHSSTSENPKSALRKEATALRAQLPMTDISHDICGLIGQWPLFGKAEHVLLYFPFRNEVDLMPLVSRFSEKHWYLPVTGSGGEITFYPYQPDMSLQIGKYGIAEPLPTGPAFTPEHHSPALLLVPGLLFDRQGYRLGYGKGYYDRLLNQPDFKAVSCQRAGITPEALLRDSLPHDPWDIPMQFLITEQEVYSC
jgi:5-formyltetrahydrofolate cyclo-ligase